MYKPQTFSAGDQAILLFHGLSSSPLELQMIGRGLQRAGYTVHLPHLPGYGDDGGGRRRHVSHWRDWVGKALDEFDRLREQHSQVVVGGLCIGAVLALHVAALRGQEAAAVTALSTTLEYDGWSLPWYSVFLPLAGLVPLGHRYSFRERHPYGVKDARLREWIARQMENTESSVAGAATLNARGLLEARRLIRETRRLLPQVVSPTLLIHALEDDMASPRSAEYVARHIAAQSRLVLLRDSYHMITLDQEKGKVLAEMRAFLADTIVGDQRPASHQRPASRDNVIPFTLAR